MNQQTADVTSTDNECMFKQTKFQCPNCKDERGYFGTFTYHEMMGKSPESKYHDKGYKTGDQIGQCTIHHYQQTDCRYQWLRTKESDKEHFVEVGVIYPLSS